MSAKPSKELVEMAAETAMACEAVLLLESRRRSRGELKVELTRIVAEFGERVARECAEIAAQPNITGWKASALILAAFGLTAKAAEGKDKP